MAVATSRGIAHEAEQAAAGALRRAALVHRFDPLELIGYAAAPEIEARALALVALDATETERPDPKAKGQVETLWRLTPEARRRELSKLVTDKTLDAELKKAVPDKNDTFAQHLQRALRGKMNPASVLPGERESAWAAARFAAEVMGSSQAEKEKMSEAVRELRTTLSQVAEEQRASLGLSGKLVGRRKERAALEAFAVTSAIPASDRLPISETRAIEVAAYLLGGPSGAGKSALVADVIRRWRGYRFHAPTPASWWNVREVAGFAMTSAESYVGWARSAMRRLVERTLGRAGPGRIVVLDLARLALAIGGEIEWTAELTRQIGLGSPALVRRLSALREVVRMNRMQIDPSGKSVTAMCTTSADLKQGLVDVFEAEPAGLPLVVVLDDFEEVVTRSFPVEAERLAETLFGRVLHWADSLATLVTPSGAPLFGSVRVIAAGSERPPLDDTGLARWFEARMEIRPQDEPRVPPTSETLQSAELPVPREANALDRYQKVGPLRMHADEVARLPDEQREAAVLSRLEFARQEGRAVSDSGERPEAAIEGVENPDQLFAFLRERKIGTQIDTAFTFGDFASAAAIGWRRIGTISNFPDLSEPWRLPGDPVVHWIWQTALAALAIEDASAARSRLEDYLGKFARRLDPARARDDAAGLVLAAAATVALDGRLPPELTAITQALAEKAAALSSVRTFADMRLLALHPAWRHRHVLPSKKVQIPYRRLRIFSESLLEKPHPSLQLDGQDSLVAFADARIEAPNTAREIDAFAASDRSQIELFLSPSEDQYGRLADVLVGLSPELYDVVVITLIDVDKTVGAAIDHAIDATRDRAPFWPRDVVPETTPVRDRDRRAGLIARAVIHADRCGLLCGLLESATERVESKRLRDVMRLVQRYEALRRRAFAGDETGQGDVAPPGAEPRGT